MLPPNGEEDYVIVMRVASAIRLRKTIKNLRKIRIRKKTKKYLKSMIEYFSERYY